MSDLISRQAVIDVALPYCPDDDGTCSKSGDDLRNLLDDIENLPSAQPCYKTDHGYMWLCPECGLAVHSDYDRCVRCGWERRTDEGD